MLVRRHVSREENDVVPTERERERERSLLFFYFIFDSFIRSVPFRFVWFGSYEMGSKERKRMERGLVEEVSRGLLA